MKSNARRPACRLSAFHHIDRTLDEEFSDASAGFLNEVLSGVTSSECDSGNGEEHSSTLAPDAGAIPDLCSDEVHALLVLQQSAVERAPATARQRRSEGSGRPAHRCRRLHHRYNMAGVLSGFVPLRLLQDAAAVTPPGEPMPSN
ncbi:hypothetical protein CHLRE_09g403955v5 [Chlamydomonas reinhardtii]|uniref:Uncharacterized protein n=1 Tax=Chlamydomonas reinhardtii TaxID=3055 RepID=A0A2K3DCM5_CHLRE|nr:uncharacterized protein CHLRE_09g403955v5 [Chlamydomonas reinhardtii]PNW78278.1 hypothetical protein CHLRE_09g403955v5 [Chlamydomonas reinhardtii]